MLTSADCIRPMIHAGTPFLSASGVGDGIMMPPAAVPAAALAACAV
jgi:hypothetical protein